MSASWDLSTSSGGRGQEWGGSDLAGAEPATDALWRSVRVVGPAGAVDVTLPAARPVAELVDELVTSLLPRAPLAEPGRQWHLHRVGRAPLDPTTPLAAARLRHGEVLHLTPDPAPEPVGLVDDALDALARGASRDGRWTLGAAGAATGAAAIACAVGAALLTLLARTGPALPLLLAAGLLLAALWLRSQARSAADLGSEVAALATLPAWTCAGIATARLLGGEAHQQLLLAGLTLAAGALAAAVVAPHRLPWWAFAGTAGATVAVGGGVVAADLLDARRAAAVLGTVLLVVVASLPWLVTRTASWSEPAPEAREEASLLARARFTRGLLSGVTAAVAGAVSVCATMLAVSEDDRARWLAAALAVVLGLRARRSRFVADSLAMIVSAALPLALLTAGLVARGGPTPRLLVLAGLAALVAALLALLAVVRLAATGDDTALSRLTRPRARRALDVAETLVAVTVLPLLAGVLGVYSAAADAGSRL